MFNFIQCMYVNIFDMLVGFYNLTLGLFQSLMSYGGLY